MKCTRSKHFFFIIRVGFYLSDMISGSNFSGKLAKAAFQWSLVQAIAEDISVKQILFKCGTNHFQTPNCQAKRILSDHLKIDA